MKQLLLLFSLLLLLTSCKFQGNPVGSDPQFSSDTLRAALPQGASYIGHTFCQQPLSVSDTNLMSGDAYLYNSYENYLTVAQRLDSAYRSLEASFFDTASLLLFCVERTGGDSLTEHAVQSSGDSLFVSLTTEEWPTESNAVPNLLMAYQICVTIKDVKEDPTLFTYDTLHTAFPEGNTITHYGLQQKFFDTTTAKQHLTKTMDTYIIDTYLKYTAVRSQLDSSLLNLTETFFDSTYLALFITERTGGDSIVSFEENTLGDSLSVVFKTAKFKADGGFFPHLSIHYQLAYAIKKEDKTVYAYDTLQTVLPVGMPLLSLGLKEHFFSEDKADEHLEKSLDAYIIDSYEKYTTMKQELDASLHTLDEIFFDTKKLAIFSMLRTGGDKIVGVENVRVDDSLNVILKTEKYQSDDGFFPILALYYQLAYAVEKDLEPLQKFRIKNQIGDTLCYKRVLIDLAPDVDTLKAFSVWTITKDTVINNETLLIYEGIEYQESEGKIDTIPRRSLVKQDNRSVEVTDFNLGFLGKELIGGPLRSLKEIKTLRFSEIRGYLLQRAGFGSRNTISIEGPFEDHNYVLRYPLDEGFRWNTRDIDNKWEHLNIDKVCHGLDTIVHRGASIQTVKTELLSGETLDLDDLFFFQWYDEKGVVKSEIDFGAMEFSNGEILNAHEYYTRIPFSKVDLSTLKPY